TAICRGETATGIALDEAFHHHGGKGLAGDACMLPIGVACRAEQEDPRAPREVRGDGFRFRLLAHPHVKCFRPRRAAGGNVGRVSRACCTAARAVWGSVGASKFPVRRLAVAISWRRVNLSNTNG